MIRGSIECGNAFGGQDYTSKDAQLRFGLDLRGADTIRKRARFFTQKLKAMQKRGRIGSQGCVPLPPVLELRIIPPSRPFRNVLLLGILVYLAFKWSRGVCEDPWV